MLRHLARSPCSAVRHARPQVLQQIHQKSSNNRVKWERRPIVVKTRLTASGSWHARLKQTRMFSTESTPDSLSNTTTYSQQYQQRIAIKARTAMLREAHQLLQTYIAKKDFQGAITTIENYHQLGITLNSTDYNIVLGEAVKYNYSGAVEKILEYFNTRSIPYDSYTYTHVMRWKAHKLQYDELKKLWLELKTERHDLINANLASFLLFLVRIRALDENVFTEVIEIIEKKGIKLTVKGYHEILLRFSAKKNYPEFGKWFTKYMDALAQGQVQDHQSIWPLVIRAYSMWREGDWIAIVYHAVQRAQYHAPKEPRYWQYLLFGLSYNHNIKLFQSVLGFIVNQLKLSPTLEMLRYYCICITGSPLMISQSLTQKIHVSDTLPTTFPSNPIVVEAWNNILKISRSFNLQMDSICCNNALYALTTSRNANYAVEIAQKLEEALDKQDSEFTVSVKGYVGLTILATNSKEPKIIRLEKLNKIAKKALECVAKEIKAKKLTQSISILYNTLLCAYAELEDPNVTTQLYELVATMKENRASPRGLAECAISMELSKSAMDKIVKLMKEHWPSLQQNDKIMNLYFLYCLFDKIRNGELQDVDVHDRASVPLLKDKLIEVINMCSSAFKTTDLDTGIFSLCARCFAYHGIDIGVRAILQVIDELESLKKQAEHQNQYWMYLIVALTLRERMDEAIAILDEMKSVGISPSTQHFSRLIMAEKRMPILESLFQRLLEEGLNPDLIIAFAYKSTLKVVNEPLPQWLREQLENYFPGFFMGDSKYEVNNNYDF